MSYADVEYLGMEHQDAEFVNGKWYFEGSIGEVHAFQDQSRVKLLNKPGAKKRHGSRIPQGVRLFGIAQDAGSSELIGLAEQP